MFLLRNKKVILSYTLFFLGPGFIVFASMFQEKNIGGIRVNLYCVDEKQFGS